ncbi:probable xyloglucan galactosyltransferase GT12 [Coffea eugenioides]|uniref:probable xyloglucan galactosyltransferase GT12 n=1 Tax=Coffea eugenioides TaxID=49369 RepID=UPI000F614E87|nr:probable xyloglucan galactosyltransferase GT12 [Coffea eugenioides]
MDGSITAMLRNKIWFVFCALFVFWFLLLYGFDWSFLPGLATISHEKSIQSLDPNSIRVTDNHEGKEDVTSNLMNATNFGVDNSGNTTNAVAGTKEKKFNDWSTEDEVSEDVDDLEKELEPIFLKDDANRGKEEQQNKCRGRYIYVHDLPSRFNDDLLKQCKSLNKWTDMCQYFVNNGLGSELGNPAKIFSRTGWFNTHQFSLEVIFHNRMKQYECLTNDSSEAAAVYVPYYAGLDVSRHLWGSNASVRDSDSLSLIKWLRERPEWDVMWGRDHFMVAGRITWDFRRGIDDDNHWGNKLMVLPESKNMTMLTIESSPWNSNDFAIPYPTYFHPWTDNDIVQWQNRMRKQKRKSLFCFAGAPRPNIEDSIRGEVMNQCKSSNRRCCLMECSDQRNKCQKPVHIMKMFQNSVFCLQPPGDSFTRRSTFDSILAGCIPVFFTPASAYVQYLWHLPRDFNKYSVLIPEDDVKNRRVSIEKKLSQISKSRVSAMREEVIKLIPNVTYADPRSRWQKFEDAFDLTVKGVLERLESLRQEMEEGKNASLSYDEEDSWKYFTFGKVDKHEWDHFFLRTDRSKYY